jgi:hypothetical protein
MKAYCARETHHATVRVLPIPGVAEVAGGRSAAIAVREDRTG